VRREERERVTIDVMKIEPTAVNRAKPRPELGVPSTTTERGEMRRGGRARIAPPDSRILE
jgi:hypothetical protein